MQTIKSLRSDSLSLAWRLVRHGAWGMIVIAAIGPAASAQEMSPDAQPPAEAISTESETIGARSLAGRIIASNELEALFCLDSGDYALVARRELCDADEAQARERESGAAPSVLISPEDAQQRAWTSVEGRVVEAALVAVDGQRLVMILPSGDWTGTSFARLADADQAHVREIIERRRDALAADAVADHAEANQVEDRVASRAKPLNALQASAVTSPAEPPGGASLGKPRRLVHVRISEDYLQSLLKDEPGAALPFTEVINGSYVRGTSVTNGHRTVSLAPSSNRAIVDLRFSGNNVANSVSFGQWAQVTSRSFTRLEALKRLTLDESGISMAPTLCNACAVNQTCSICPTKGGVRGAIIVRRASRDIAARSASTNRETASRVSRGVSRSMDRDVGAAVTRLDSVAKELLAALREGGLELGMNWTSGVDQLSLVVYKRGVAEDAAEAAPPGIAGDPPAAIWIHNTLVQQFLKDSRLQAAMQPIIERLGAPGDAGKNDKGLVAPDYALGWSGDGHWLTVSVRRGSSADPVHAASKPAYAEMSRPVSTGR